MLIVVLKNKRNVDFTDRQELILCKEHTSKRNPKDL